ncbi:DUF6765 family protein [Desulfobacterium sp. N47]|uniref:Uncharacterized protein n=1 Tax=uncultured Desulfobacterium sp. TaxID=201089 RepID=E1YLF0_9BACT|nr:hypothetical protein N47_E44450 [uncultured Desulfobacterium sp.]
MDTEFHYYITGIIAKAAGFSQDEAKTIATAAEYVDENDVCLKISDPKGGDDYENYISQTMNILQPKRKLLRIYPVFHFVPGDPMDEKAARRDGKMHLLNTTPNNKIANNLIDEAFNASDDTRLYRIGIATHAYSDTWAHQNFVGWYDIFNNISLDIKPDVGHANAEHHPDWPAHRWEDVRLADDQVHNTERFLEAAEYIYMKYRAYNLKRNCIVSEDWSQLRIQLIEAIGSSFSGPRNYYREDRIRRYNDLAPWLGDFDESEWFKEAIDIRVKGFKDSQEGLLSMFTMFKDDLCWKQDADKEKTHWFRFQEAVKEHQGKAMPHLDEIFKKMGVNLHAL